MSLTNKISLLFIAVFVILVSAVFILSKEVILKTFLDINIDNAKTNNVRVEEAMDNEIRNLSSAAADWAAWDESYNYVLGKNDNYISENINTNTLENLGTDYMVYTDNSGKLINFVTTDEEIKKNYSQELVDSIINEKIFFEFSGLKSDVTGLFKYKDSVFAVSSHPIVTNTFQGPIAGSLIFAKIIDNKFIDTLSERTKLPVNTNFNLDKTGEKYQSIPGFIIFSNKIIGQVDLKDIHQKNIKFLYVESPTATYAEGQKTTSLFLKIIVSLGLITILFTAFFIRFTIIKPILKLTKVSNIMAEGNLDIRTETKSNDEIGVLGKSFNSMAEKLKKSFEEVQKSKEREIQKSKEVIKLKDEFVFIAAHELRTPVTAITGFTQMLTSYSKDLSPEIRDKIQILSDSAKRLNELLFNLLETSRMEIGALKLELTPVNINELISKLVPDYSSMLTQKDIKLLTNLDYSNDTVLADKIKLVEVLNNLIVNAIKYNREKGSIEIKTSKKHDKLLIEIIDTGYGIPDNKKR